MARAKSGFLSGFGTALQIFKAITDEVLAIGGTDNDLKSLLTDRDKCRRMAEFIVGEKNDVPSKYDSITVPDLPAADLVALAKKEIGFTYLNPNLAAWDFITDERGKTYEVMTWTPGRYVSTAEVCTHFKEKGFSGNTAAFVSWVIKNPQLGWCASLLEEDTRLWRGPESEHLFRGPYFCRNGYYHSRLDLFILSQHLESGVGVGWNDGCSFVAFREIPPA